MEDYYFAQKNVARLLSGMSQLKQSEEALVAEESLTTASVSLVNQSVYDTVVSCSKGYTLQ